MLPFKQTEGYILKNSPVTKTVANFDELFKTESRINDIYMSMAEEGADVDALMEEVGELQDRLARRTLVRCPPDSSVTSLSIP